MRLLFLLILSSGHLFTDVVGGALPILLPVLVDEFGLSYTAVGVVILVANLSSSVIQPLFGIWSDRTSCRWFLPAGCIISALGMALAGVAASYALILFGVFLSGIGTAAYHPEGSKQAFLIGGKQKATALSIYSIGGNIGFGLGPLTAYFLLGLAGRKGMAGLLVPAVLIALLIHWALPTIARLVDSNLLTERQSRVSDTLTNAGRPLVVILVLLVLIVTLRSLIHIGLTNYIPLYYINYLKTDQKYASLLLTIFLMAGALGTLIGGPLADLWGRKRVMVISFLLVFPSLWFFPYSSGIWSMILAGWSGFALVSSFAVTVVYAQELLPHHVGLASGLILGFAVGMGALGGLLFGMAADAWGLLVVLKIISVLPVPALLLTLILPSDELAGFRKTATQP